MQTIAMLIHNDFQDDEFRQPYNALRRAGYDVTVVGPEAHKTYRGKTLRERAVSDIALEAAAPADYAALVIPGGYAPDRLRMVPGIEAFVRAFALAGKPIAAICHGPQLLISADLVRGRRVTGYPGIAVDLRNAGAHYVDEPVAIDGKLITSRRPADLPQFCEALLATIRGDVHAHR